MKKVFAIVAIAAMFVACNKPAQTEEGTVDSVATEVVETVDSAALDSTVVAAADSLAAVN
ncbi:MAG TPA: hypothetical protein GXZ87_03590 [Bacteroidales bacterium]|nr:hypothetical protein [Bacteroidales bacterium]